MKKSSPVRSFREVENFGRARLSTNFFMRDFLHSEVGQVERIPNLPTDPALVLHVGRQLCETLLEPLQARFGRISIRSAYRSAEVNETGHRRRYSCANNERNHARHIWDVRDAEGYSGASACIVVPWFLDRYEAGEDWRSLAWWIHDHLTYSELTFFNKLCAFNIAWHERPKRVIRSFISPTGILTYPAMPNHLGSHAEWYQHWEL